MPPGVDTQRVPELDRVWRAALEYGIELLTHIIYVRNDSIIIDIEILKCRPKKPSEYVKHR